MLLTVQNLKQDGLEVDEEEESGKIVCQEMAKAHSVYPSASQRMRKQII